MFFLESCILRICFIYVYVCVNMCVLEPVESNPLDAELQAVGSHLMMVWEQNCEPLQEQQSLLVAEPFLTSKTT